MPAEKICIVCGVDCADRPRMKDSKGQYACRSCVEAKKRPRPQQKPTPPIEPIAIAEEPAPAVGGGAGFDMDQFLGGVETGDAEAVSYCPNCGAPRAAGAVVCMDCGFNSETGQAINTKVLKAKAKKEKRERTAPRLSGGVLFALIALGMVAGIALLAQVSEEAAIAAALIAGVWQLVAYVIMVFAAFKDEDKFWGIIGALFWIPLAGGLCALSFALYYCTIGSSRGSLKLNYWAAVLAGVIVVVTIASKDLSLISQRFSAGTP